MSENPEKKERGRPPLMGKSFEGHHTDVPHPVEWDIIIDSIKEEKGFDSKAAVFRDAFEFYNKFREESYDNKINQIIREDNLGFNDLIYIALDYYLDNYEYLSHIKVNKHYLLSKYAYNIIQDGIKSEKIVDKNILPILAELMNNINTSLTEEGRKECILLFLNKIHKYEKIIGHYGDMKKVLDELKEYASFQS